MENEELFSKIKDLEQRTESEKGKYEDLKNDLDKARQELKAFSETKKEIYTKTKMKSQALFILILQIFSIYATISQHDESFFSEVFINPY